MSKPCQITIVFDNASRHYLPDDIIKGHVHLDVHLYQDYGDLCIKHCVYTHGKGSMELEVIDNVTIPLDKLEVGHYEFTFEFTAAKAPFTYHGMITNLDWCIEAEVKEHTSELASCKERIDFLLTPAYISKQTMDHLETTVFEGGDNNEATSTTVKDMVVFSLIALFFLMAFIVISMIWRSPVIIFCLFIFTALPAILWFGYLLPKSIKQYRFDKKIKHVKFITDIVSHDDTQSDMSVKLDIFTADKIEVKSILAQFVTSETAINNDGSSRNDYAEVTILSQAKIDINKTVPVAQNYITQPMVLTMPDDWLPVFAWKYNKVARQLRLAIETDNHTYHYETNVHFKDDEQSQSKLPIEKSDLYHRLVHNQQSRPPHVFGITDTLQQVFELNVKPALQSFQGETTQNPKTKPNDINKPSSDTSQDITK